MFTTRRRFALTMWSRASGSPRATRSAEFAFFGRGEQGVSLIS